MEHVKKSQKQELRAPPRRTNECDGKDNAKAPDGRTINGSIERAVENAKLCQAVGTELASH